MGDGVVREGVDREGKRMDQPDKGEAGAVKAKAATRRKAHRRALYPYPHIPVRTEGVGSLELLLPATAETAAIHVHHSLISCHQPRPAPRPHLAPADLPAAIAVDEQGGLGARAGLRREAASACLSDAQAKCGTSLSPRGRSEAGLMHALLTAPLMMNAPPSAALSVARYV